MRCNVGDYECNIMKHTVMPFRADAFVEENERWCGLLLQIDAMDYDKRLQAYSSLKAEAWARMIPVQALPLLHQSVSDMRRTDDLAIRSAAAQALGRFITAGSMDVSQGEHAGSPKGFSAYWLL